MAKIDLKKWICSMIECFPDFKESGKIPCMYEQALKDQGLEYKDGQIVEINSSNDKAESKDIEIPFGAYDSELIANEWTIPEGYTAEVKDGKVIVQKTEIKPFEIKKDRWYMCIKNLNDNYGTTAFIKGEVYKSTADGTLIPCNSNIPYTIVVVDTYFRPATEDEIPHEPKFKVGNWVVHNKKVLYQVKEIRDERYELVDEYNDTLSVPFLADFGLEKWTIQDAKDGDVLSSGLWTLIFRKIEDGFVYCHCASSSFEEFSTSNTGCFDSEQLHPATKEQRDLLFAKMKEAGYEFDFTTKSRRKIPDLDNTNGTNPMTEFEKAVYELTYDYIGAVTVNGTELKERAASLLSLARKQIEEETSNKHINIKTKKE